jgi:AcrR family transcriptional regulator
MSDIATQRRRRLPAAQRRQTLIEAASELFATHGYDRVTLDEVARRCRVTKVIVYRHFASKKDLYLQLLAIHRDELLQTLADGMAAELSLEERVPAVADAWFAYVEAQPFALGMLFRDVTGDPEISEFHAGMRETARAAIVALLSAEPTLGLPRSMLEPIAEALRAAMTGLAMWWLERREVPRDVLVGAIIATTWRGLAQSVAA